MDHLLCPLSNSQNSLSLLLKFSFAFLSFLQLPLSIYLAFFSVLNAFFLKNTLIYLKQKHFILCAEENFENTQFLFGPRSPKGAIICTRWFMYGIFYIPLLLLIHKGINYFDSFWRNDFMKQYNTIYMVKADMFFWDNISFFLLFLDQC